MSGFEQVGFGSDDFTTNPEQQCPCLLLLDTSHSMQGASDFGIESRHLDAEGPVGE